MFDLRRLCQLLSYQVHLLGVGVLLEGLGDAQDRVGRAHLHAGPPRAGSEKLHNFGYLKKFDFWKAKSDCHVKSYPWRVATAPRDFAHEPEPLRKTCIWLEQDLRAEAAMMSNAMNFCSPCRSTTISNFGTFHFASRNLSKGFSKFQIFHFSAAYTVFLTC